MTRAFAAAAVWLAASGIAPAADQQGTQVFRSSVDAIAVPVAVFENGRPVRDLPLDRFALFDNGEMQDVAIMSVGSVPIDVTLVLDTSGSVWGEAIRTLRRDVQTIVGALAAEDRVRLLTFSQGVRETIPLATAGRTLDLASIAAGGATAFYNAIAASLLPLAAPGRPHLVVALGDGGDNASWLGAEDISRIATRAEIVLQVVVRDRWSGTALMGTARGRGWLPYQTPPSSDGLEEAARITGGGYQRVKADEPLTDVFSQIISDFKSTYLLWFEPKGTPAPGWHELVVRIRDGGEYDVRARRGYYGG